LAGAPAGVRSAVAEGCILCAERVLADGNNETAAAIYDEVRHADVPQQRILEATRGAILARGSWGIPLLVEQLKSPDEARFQIALSTARELAGSDVAEALAGELAAAPPERAALIVLAIGDRDDATLPQAVLQAARSGDARVRLAAIEVIGKLGGPTSVDTLLEIASSGDSDATVQLSQAAQDALANLPGDAVDAELVRRASDADGGSLAVLFETIGQRRIDASAQLVKAVDHPDDAVRQAALKALGETAGPGELAVLVAEAIDARSANDAKVAAQALETACVRMPDREATAAQLAAALPRAQSAT
jgi:HEAT repeat protein